MDLQVVQKYFDFLFENINGFETSMSSRKQHDLNSQSLTYGEIRLESFKQILDLAHPKKNEIFYDLGSGVGKPVFAAALLFSFKKCTGIELLPELYEKSLTALERFNSQIKSLTNNSTEIEFLCDDIIKTDFYDADVIYIASTCFDRAFMMILADLMKNLKNGTRIITLTKQLEAPYLKLVEKRTFPMSWGDSTIIVVEKHSE